jgi:hypothetical protein
MEEEVSPARMIPHVARSSPAAPDPAAHQRHHQQRLRRHKKPEDDGEIPPQKVIEGKPAQRAVRWKPVHADDNSLFVSGADNGQTTKQLSKKLPVLKGHSFSCAVTD